VRADTLALDEQSEQEVLRPHEIVAHTASLGEGDLDDRLHARCGDDLLDNDPG
jgi:hypothetical protein